MSVLNVISLLGGVGLFLYGMTVMSTGLKNAAGDKLRAILEKVTGNRIAAVLIGILVTMLIQSSSATDMMVIGFVHSGLMSLGQAIGVIMGANIGTTVTAQITAFDLTAYAPGLLFLGCVMALFVKKATGRHIGSILLGFGMLFVGIGVMKTAIAPLSKSEEFKQALSALSHPAAAVLFGVLFTALLQSSSSSVVIFQAFAVEGLLDYRQCVYLVIGAAIGSVTPNLLASLTTGRSGKRTALLNLYFNLLRAALLLLLTTLLPGVLEWIKNLSPNDVARQVANTHTLFAVASVLVMLPGAPLIVKLAERTVPLRAEEKREKEEHRLVYLTNVEKMVPSVALRQAMLEVDRMGEIARDNLATAIRYFFDPAHEEWYSQVLEREKTVDYLDHAISDKLVTMRSLQLADHDVFRLSRIIRVVSNFERISDHAENVVEFALRMQTAKATISDAGLAELKVMADTVMECLDVSMEIFEKEKFSLLPHAEALEQRVDDMQEQFIQNHVDRLMSTACNPLGGVIFTDMCTDLERCSDQAINIATALYDGHRERE
ncbi:MAG: Na/Pi cotransporter family protein [Clostridiales bacterium]|nr:Na/Pi cotransporter family protein [Clostridiales bacterium]